MKKTILRKPGLKSLKSPSRLEPALWSMLIPYLYEKRHVQWDNEGGHNLQSRRIKYFLISYNIQNKLNERWRKSLPTCGIMNSPTCLAKPIGYKRKNEKGWTISSSNISRYKVIKIAKQCKIYSNKSSWNWRFLR